jgi:hypothetical protein
LAAGLWRWVSCSNRLLKTAAVRLPVMPPALPVLDPQHTKTVKMFRKIAPGRTSGRGGRICDHVWSMAEIVGLLDRPQ